MEEIHYIYKEQKEKFLEELRQQGIKMYKFDQDVIKDAQELFGKMRGFTQEESDEYEAALDKMFEPTGISFYDEHVGINFLDNMKDFTLEEQKRYNESIRKICKPTGRNLFDVLEQNKDKK